MDRVCLWIKGRSAVEQAINLSGVANLRCGRICSLLLDEQKLGIVRGCKIEEEREKKLARVQLSEDNIYISSINH